MKFLAFCLSRLCLTATARSLLILALIGLWACDDSASADPPRTGGEADTGGAGGAVPDAGPDAGPVEQTVEITDPMEGAVIAGRFVGVSGRVVGPIQAVTVNGQAAAVNNGQFTLRLELESGSHELVAQAGEATDRVRITVDTAPPRIDITAPARATYTDVGQTDMSFTITDDAGLSEVLFGGDLGVDPAGGPDFSLPGLPLAIGWNILRLEATDSAGNKAREHVAVLHGNTQDPTALIPAALRLHVGPAGFDALEAVALDLLAGQNLTALVPNPVFDSGPFRAEVTNITYMNPTMELTPEPGQVRVRLRLEQVIIALGLFVNDNQAYEVGAGAGAVEITGLLIPRVEAGEIIVRFVDLQVAFTELEVQAGGVPEFENNPAEGRALVEEIAGEVVGLLANRFIPDLLAGLLARLAEPFELELLGAQLALRLVPDVIVVSAQGLSARVSVGVDLANPAPGEPGLAGYVATRVPWDGVPTTDGVGIAVDDDLINLLLYQVWRAGVLFPRLDSASELGAEAGLVTGLLGNLVRRAYPDIDAETPIAVGTRLPLPPMVSVRKENGAVGLVLGVGDLEVDVDTDNAADRDLLEGAASLELRTAIGVTAGDEPGSLALDLEVIDSITAFDVTTAALRGEAEASVEEPINSLLGRLGALLPGLLRDFSIPTLGFVTFVDLRADAVGPDGSFIGLFGNIAAP
jgi:hypothetical protein